MDIPPKVAIKASIKPGSVYYFPHESLSSPEPHYFIVINLNPIDEQVLLLVCASSQIEKVKKRNRANPAATLVEISKQQYTDFTCDSIVNCNYVLPEIIDNLVTKLSNHTLKLKSEMNTAIVEKLRLGVLASREVPVNIRRQLGAKISLLNT